MTTIFLHRRMLIFLFYGSCNRSGWGRSIWHARFFLGFNRRTCTIYFARASGHGCAFGFWQAPTRSSQVVGVRPTLLTSQKTPSFACTNYDGPTSISRHRPSSRFLRTLGNILPEHDPFLPEEQLEAIMEQLRKFPSVGATEYARQLTAILLPPQDSCQHVMQAFFEFLVRCSDCWSFLIIYTFI